jgi:superfamily II DNA helicase RecQ
VLQGRDALGVLPTGGGRSLVFQLAFLFLPRPVVVVSPLTLLSEVARVTMTAALTQNATEHVVVSLYPLPAERIVDAVP